MTTEKDHGRENALGWASTIAELVAAMECDYDRLQELRDEHQALYDAAKESRELAEEIASDEGQDFEAKRSHNEANEDAEAEFQAWMEDNGEELKQLTADATLDGEECTDGESARERIQEGPLSVEVRSPWYAPGADEDDRKPSEFRILLTTGGPALQIRGELDEHMQPDRAWLEYQDWGTPWTQLINAPLENSTLLTYCQQFYFGE